MNKTSKLFSVVLVLALGLSMLFSGCSLTGPEMKISIDGDEFQLDCEVGDILSAGYELAEYDHKNAIMTEYFDVPARTLITSGMFLYKDGVASHVEIFIYNKSTSDAKFADCNVYKFEYDAGDYASESGNDDGLKVLMNGVDFRFTDRKSVIADLETQGFKFKDSDKEDFFKSGDAFSSSLITSTGLIEKYLTVYNNYDYESGERYINGFEIELKIDYDTSGAWSS